MTLQYSGAKLDAPGHESARVFYQADSWNLEGTAVFSHEQLLWRLDYRIVCDSRWHTRQAKVTGWVGERPIEIELIVSVTSVGFLTKGILGKWPRASIWICMAATH